MKKAFLILIAILLNFAASLLVLFIIDFEIHREENEVVTSESAKDSSMLHLAFVGDLMCHEPQFQSAEKADGSYDFYPPFRVIQPFLSEPDMTFGNLETVFKGTELGRKYAGYPTFNTPDAYANALVKAGFDALFTANNHSLDGGMTGIKRTISVLAENGLPNIGTFVEASDTATVQIYDLKGIKFSTLAYTEISNGSLSESNQYMLNRIDTARIREDITRCRSKGVEIIVVNFHFGTEYEREPNDYQKQIVRHAINCGADIIVGQHPHVLQPIQLFRGSENCTLDTGIVAFSLGNFFAHQMGRFTNSGLILNVKLKKDLASGKIRMEEYFSIPTYTATYQEKSKNQYLIVHSSLAMQRLLPKRLRRKIPLEAQLLSESQFEKMEQSFADTEQLLSGSNEKIEVK